MQQNRELRRRVRHSKQFWSEGVVDSNIKDLAGILQQISGICDKTDGQKVFSLSEIRSILLERNYLKSRLNDMEKEVNRLKSLNETPVESPNNQIKQESNFDDLPVEGPINREPDDKLFPEKQNKILRL